MITLRGESIKLVALQIKVDMMVSKTGVFRVYSKLTVDWQLSISPTSYRTTSLMKTATAFRIKATKRFMWM